MTQHESGVPGFKTNHRSGSFTKHCHDLWFPASHFLTNRQITTLMIPEISKWLGINPDVRVTVVWGCDSMTKIIYIQFEILALSNDRSFHTPKFVNDYTSLLIY